MRGKWKINLPKHTSFLMLNTREKQVMAAGSTCLSVCLSGPSHLFVRLPLCLQGGCGTSSVWDGGCLLCLSPFLRHSSSSPLTWNQSATQQQKPES